MTSDAAMRDTSVGTGSHRHARVALNTPRDSRECTMLFYWEEAYLFHGLETLAVRNCEKISDNSGTLTAEQRGKHAVGCNCRTDSAPKGSN
jgi:hypothetical protein